MPDSVQTEKPQGTAAELIEAALRLFGRKGFAATSTREIAAAANTNVASIAYHFGGKDGLRRACGQEIIRRVGAVMGPATPEVDLPPEMAIRAIEGAIRAMVRFMLTRREAEDIVPFMLRELADNGPVLDDVYVSMFAPVHGRLCRFWSAVTGQPAESERTRLLVFTLIGQLLYFRIGRPIVERRMGWHETGADEVRQVADILIGNLHAIIESERRP
ncbi:MAG TPA: CerR family C-terminal domain-containing protein [Albidovulum sp.]|uniref:CerR family C-terminal domain-containing protein n=1 Tax=Albidovulum sp. TaxID=1872424 RepID=UPI002B53F943|nr:CerR family C-terminal domain-containing protein [Albidovulum sp.]